MALARELDGAALDGLRVVELGCGLAVPSIAAARAGADVLATDWDSEALDLVAQNASANDVQVETAAVDWAHADELVTRGPFDLVLAADVLYERASVALRDRRRRLRRRTSAWPTPARRRRRWSRPETAGPSTRASAALCRSTFGDSTERPGRRASERRGDAQVPLLAHRGSRARRWQECRSHGRAAL